MADSYYPPAGADDGADAGAPDQDEMPDGDKPATEGNEDGDGKDKSEDEGETALVSASAFGGKTPEPGQRCTFEVVHCYEDECELKYVKDEGDGDKAAPASGDSDEMAGAMGKLNALAT